MPSIGTLRGDQSSPKLRKRPWSAEAEAVGRPPEHEQGTPGAGSVLHRGLGVGRTCVCMCQCAANSAFKMVSFYFM